MEAIGFSQQNIVCQAGVMTGLSCRLRRAVQYTPTSEIVMSRPATVVPLDRGAEVLMP